MILAGDIGATRTRLAAFQTEGNRLNCVVQKIYAEPGAQRTVGGSAGIHSHRRHSGAQRLLWGCRASPRRQEQDFEFALDDRLQRIGGAVEAQFRPVRRNFVFDCIAVVGATGAVGRIIRRPARRTSTFPPDG